MKNYHVLIVCVLLWLATMGSLLMQAHKKKVERAAIEAKCSAVVVLDSKNNWRCVVPLQ